MASKRRSSDAGNLDTPKTSQKVLPLSEKGEYNTVRYFEGERDHIHITFIIVCYNNCSIL